MTIDARHLRLGDNMEADGDSLRAKDVSARVHRTTNQSITSGVWTAISFDAERYDTDAFHEGVTNPTRLTMPSDGKYKISASIEMASSGGGTGTYSASVGITLNGTNTFLAVVTENTTTDASATRLTVEAEWEFTAGDYVEIEVHHNAGVARNLVSQSSYSPEATIRKVS